MTQADNDRRLVQNLLIEAETINRYERGFYDRLKVLVGREVRIKCDRYNGQQHGSSRRKLKGKVLTVGWVHRWDDTIGLGFWDHDAGIDIKKVEFV